jgi:aminopeptidase N
VYPLANFDVTLRFKDPNNVPVVASSGQAEPADGGMHYTLERGRDFVLSMGRQLQVVSADVDGVSISSYFYPGSEVGGKAVLDATTKALRTFTALFGPYPHKTLAAVQGDFNDGMEFDGLYYLSNSFYNLYDGTQNNYLTMVAVHETSHQWWFGRVASDQNKNPWMDESLATYCEKLFYEKNYPDSVNWWWSYRIDFYQPQGLIDGDVPSYGGFTPYTNATYRQGAHFFEELRQAVGDEAFFAFLKNYATQMDGKIAEPADFFRILSETLAQSNNKTDLSPLIGKYFAKLPQ